MTSSSQNSDKGNHVNNNHKELKSARITTYSGGSPGYSQKKESTILSHSSKDEKNKSDDSMQDMYEKIITQIGNPITKSTSFGSNSNRFNNNHHHNNYDIEIKSIKELSLLREGKYYHSISLNLSNHQV